MYWFSNCFPQQVQRPLTWRAFQQCPWNLTCHSSSIYTSSFHEVGCFLCPKHPPLMQASLAHPDMDKTVALESDSPESKGVPTISLSCDPGSLGHMTGMKINWPNTCKILQRYPVHGTRAPCQLLPWGSLFKLTMNFLPLLNPEHTSAFGTDYILCSDISYLLLRLSYLN